MRPDQGRCPASLAPLRPRLSTTPSSFNDAQRQEYRYRWAAAHERASESVTRDGSRPAREGENAETVNSPSAFPFAEFEVRALAPSRLATRDARRRVSRCAAVSRILQVLSELVPHLSRQRNSVIDGSRPVVFVLTSGDISKRIDAPHARAPHVHARGGRETVQGANPPSHRRRRRRRRSRRRRVTKRKQIPRES